MNISIQVQNFINKWSKICNPDKIHYCDGSDSEMQTLKDKLVNNNFMKKLSRPNSYCVNTDINDVARTESATFICTEKIETVGPTNNWKNSNIMYPFLKDKFKDVMKGRIMYVIPFQMGTDEFGKIAIQITDSPYVVISMNIMTKIKSKIYESSDFIKCVHSVGNHGVTCEDKWVSDKEKYITHFIEKNMIVSFGSGYGGNSLLGKKSIALRLSSYDFYKNKIGLAEHMLIMGITNPQGVKKYFLAAFPSSCGKTNLAMIKPTGIYSEWKISTVGDDIAWIYIKDNKLYAINPENGFFGVAPGTNINTNPNAIDIISSNTIFTNVGYNKTTNDIYWDKLYNCDNHEIYDWQNNLIDNPKKAAHPNSRFTSSLSNCKILDENIFGVPISAIIFGGRRENTIPLVREAKSWTDGVYIGATLSSENTSAITDNIGNIRYDPFAMLPFCGYSMSDYFNYWLSFQNKNLELPKIFGVNWFNKKDREYVWPGFSENMRVLEFIFDRLASKDQLPFHGLASKDQLPFHGLASKDQLPFHGLDNKNNIVDSPIGYLPKNLNLKELDIKYDVNNIDRDLWKKQLDNDLEFLGKFQDIGELLDVNKKMKDEFGF